METPTDSEILDIVNLINDKKKGEALDKATEYLYSKASQAIDQYKQTVAATYFDEPAEPLETSD
jgi:hypothetical protein